MHIYLHRESLRLHYFIKLKHNSFNSPQIPCFSLCLAFYQIVIPTIPLHHANSPGFGQWLFFLQNVYHMSSLPKALLSFFMSHKSIYSSRCSSNNSRMKLLQKVTHGIHLKITFYNVRQELRSRKYSMPKTRQSVQQMVWMVLDCRKNSSGLQTGFKDK